jgi:NADPH-dependent curcumin reductase CurA
MPDSSVVNHRIVLAARPEGRPRLSDFRTETQPIPVPQAGQLLLRTLYLSLDPYMRGRMSDAPSYAPPVEIGAVMVGGTISVVEASEHPGFARGDLVLGYAGWQEFSLSNGIGLTRLDPQTKHLSQYLGVLGMPGFTAYMGLMDIGNPQPGETVVVAAASGAVGSVVGQVAKILGCRVVGIAGSTEKCRFVAEELGFDMCIDHHAEDLPQRLASACPRGIDVYFENVGGEVFDAVLPLLNARARIPVCGLIALYNETAPPPGPDRLGLLQRTILKRRLRMQGFIISEDYAGRQAEFTAAMTPWLAAGRIKYREDVVAGLANAPQAFIGLLSGQNFGKLIVRVGAASPHEHTAG